MKSFVNITSKTQRKASFLSGPYPTGVGVSIANALRRILLSSLIGCRIDMIKVEGARHEFAVLPGVKEDLSDIIQNLKQLAFRNVSYDGPVHLILDVTDKDAVLASDIICPPDIELLNPDQVLAHLSDSTARLCIEMRVTQGRGNKLVTHADRYNIPEFDWIPIDALYNPVTSVNYEVITSPDDDTENICITITTNGTSAPDECLAMSAKILSNHSLLFTNIKSDDDSIFSTSQDTPEESVPAEIPISELGLSVRAYNCLRRNNIATLQELGNVTVEDLYKFRNLGEKTLKEISQAMQTYNLKFKESE